MFVLFLALVHFVHSRSDLSILLSLSTPAEDEAVSITRQICEAMAYTHRLGVTHRDLKPEVSSFPSSRLFVVSNR